MIDLVYMICNTCKVQCCITCKDEEKRDLNLDYGTYYYQDGKRRANVVEVFRFNVKKKLHWNPFAPQARDHNPNYDDYDYLQSDMHTVVTHNNPEYHTD